MKLIKINCLTESMTEASLVEIKVLLFLVLQTLAISLFSLFFFYIVIQSDNSGLKFNFDFVIVR